MSDKKPKNIPSGADKVYKSEGWKGWPDFLGKEKKRKELRLTNPTRSKTFLFSFS